MVIPPETSPDQIVTAIVDYSGERVLEESSLNGCGLARVHDDKMLNSMIRSASVIVVVFSVEKEENLDRVSCWTII